MITISSPSFQLSFLKLMKVRQIFKFKFNENSILTGIKDVLLRNILYENLTENKVKHFMKCYFQLYGNKLNRSFERKSKIPFTKWYVKKYHDVFKAKTKELTSLINIKDEQNDEIKNKLKEQIKETNKNLKNLKKEIKKIKDETKSA